MSAIFQDVALTAGYASKCAEAKPEAVKEIAQQVFIIGDGLVKSFGSREAFAFLVTFGAGAADHAMESDRTRGERKCPSRLERTFASWSWRAGTLSKFESRF